MIDLSGQKVLVLGASGGIGSETAVCLSELGASVVISGRREEGLAETLGALKGDGHACLPFDVRDFDQAATFMQAVVDLDGRKLTGLVYSAGVVPIRPVKSTSHGFLQDIMATNFLGFVELVRTFAHKKVCTGGSIVALSSYAALNGDKGQLAYAASKGALDSSIVVMAKELHARRIRVNALRPANVAYDRMDSDDLLPGTREITAKMKTGAIPPRNIAEHIAFLLSECAAGVSGRCFDIRGYLN